MSNLAKIIPNKFGIALWSIMLAIFLAGPCFYFRSIRYLIYVLHSVELYFILLFPLANEYDDLIFGLIIFLVITATFMLVYRFYDDNAKMFASIVSGAGLLVHIWMFFELWFNGKDIRGWEALHTLQQQSVFSLLIFVASIQVGKLILMHYTRRFRSSSY